MLVGSGPFKCDSCDEVHVGDVDGKAYEIDVDGCVWELYNMFAPMTMIAQDIIQH
jgi:hypothetical protein